MAMYPKIRNLHLWAGLAVLVPTIVIAASGIGLNHERALGLKPTKEKKPEKSRRPPETAVADMSATSSHSSLVATEVTWKQYDTAISAALATARLTWGEVPLERIELKQEPGEGVVVKVKASSVTSKQMSDEPEEIIWSVSKNTLVPMHHETYVKADGGTNWAKVCKDLHTGKFFSKSVGFLWSDLAALALILLSFTGLVLYIIPIVKKRAAKKRAALAGPIAKRPMPVVPPIPRAAAPIHAALRGDPEEAADINSTPLPAGASA